jgi:hypothetical protein
MITTIVEIRFLVPIVRSLLQGSKAVLEQFQGDGGGDQWEHCLRRGASKDRLISIKKREK